MDRSELTSHPSGWLFFWENVVGYKIREGEKFSSITDFTPDDTDTKMYIAPWGGTTLQELIDKAQQKWPGCDVTNLHIDSEYIHTHCIYYDRYDSGDYTNYITIELK